MCVVFRHVCTSTHGLFQGPASMDRCANELPLATPTAMCTFLCNYSAILDSAVSWYLPGYIL